MPRSSDMSLLDYFLSGYLKGRRKFIFINQLIKKLQRNKFGQEFLKLLQKRENEFNRM